MVIRHSFKLYCSGENTYRQIKTATAKQKNVLFPQPNQYLLIVIGQILTLKYILSLLPYF